MKNLFVVFVVLVLLFGCAQQDVQEEEIPEMETEEEIEDMVPPPVQPEPEDEGKLEYPWGTELNEIKQLHLEYYYVDQDALFELMDNPNLNFDVTVKGKTGIVKVWYDREKTSLKIDVYNEKTAECGFESFDYNGKEYMIKRSETLSGRTERDGFVFCDQQDTEYFWDKCQFLEHQVDERMIDLKNLDGFMLSTYIYEPMYASPLVFINPRYAGSNEVIVPTDPKHNNMEVKEIINEGFEENKMIAGRSSSKWSYPFMFYTQYMRGYVYIDKELGIPLQEYVTTVISDDFTVQNDYTEPELIYDTVVIEK